MSRERRQRRWRRTRRPCEASRLTRRASWNRCSAWGATRSRSPGWIRRPTRSSALAAALAVDAAPSSYQSTTDLALAAGAGIDEIVGTLIAAAPTVGLARVVSAAPELALGYDLEAALESPEVDDR